MLFKSLLAAALLSTSAMALAAPDAPGELSVAAHALEARDGSVIAAERAVDAHLAERDNAPIIVERQSTYECDPGYVQCSNNSMRCAKVGYFCCPDSIFTCPTGTTCGTGLTCNRGGKSNAEAMGIPAAMAFAAGAAAYLL